MEDVKRACMAIIAASINNNKLYSFIYDYANNRYIPIVINSASKEYISVYDYERGGYISGSITNLYDYPSSSFVNMVYSETAINVFDFETSNYININVSANNVSVYDFENGMWYYYSVG